MKDKLRLWLHNHGWHFWRYRNPTDRTCTMCGKRQQEYVFAIEGQNYMYKGHTWWEDVYPLPTPPPSMQKEK